MSFSILVALFALIKVVVKTILLIGIGIGGLIVGLLGELLTGICLPTIIALDPPFGHYNCSSLCKPDGNVITYFTSTVLNVDLGINTFCSNGTVPSGKIYYYNTFK